MRKANSILLSLLISALVLVGNYLFAQHANTPNFHSAPTERKHHKKDSNANARIFYIINVDSIRLDSVDLDDIESICFRKIYLPTCRTAEIKITNPLNPLVKFINLSILYEGMDTLVEVDDFYPPYEVDDGGYSNLKCEVESSNNFSFQTGTPAKYENTLAFESNSIPNPDIVIAATLTTYNRYR